VSFLILEFITHKEDMSFIIKASNHSRVKRNAVYETDLWPNGIIPYEIASSYDGK